MWSLDLYCICLYGVPREARSCRYIQCTQDLSHITYTTHTHKCLHRCILHTLYLYTASEGRCAGEPGGAAMVAGRKQLPRLAAALAHCTALASCGKCYQGIWFRLYVCIVFVIVDVQVLIFRSVCDLSELRVRRGWGMNRKNSDLRMY